MVKIIKGGFVIHSVVRGNFPEGLTFKPRPRQRGVSSEGSIPLAHRVSAVGLDFCEES